MGTDDLRRGTGNYTSTFDAFGKIMGSEGPMGLYRGAFPTILKQGTNQAVRMPLQVQIMGLIVMGDSSKNQNPIYNGAAGFFGRLRFCLAHTAAGLREISHARRGCQGVVFWDRRLR